jgi:hypothetical protein
MGYGGMYAHTIRGAHDPMGNVLWLESSVLFVEVESWTGLPVRRDNSSLTQPAPRERAYAEPYDLDQYF